MLRGILRSALSRLAGWISRTTNAMANARWSSWWKRKILIESSSWSRKKTSRVTLTRTMGRARDRDRITDVLRKWFVPRRVYAWEKGTWWLRELPRRDLTHCVSAFGTSCDIEGYIETVNRRPSKRASRATAEGRKERSFVPIHPPSLQNSFIHSEQRRKRVSIYIFTFISLIF